MQRTKLRVAMTAGISLCSLAGAAPALAQQGPAGEDIVPDDVIIVTAQFREQALQDTPLAITAVTGEMLQQRSQTNLAEVANQAPSVTLKSQSSAFGPALGANIRGVGQFDPSPAVEPGVGIYVDDVYYASLVGSVLDLLDLERVEILRGPQGTLSGRNAIGGAIKLYSRRPQGSNTGFVQGTYGSRNRLDLRASADFALADDIFARVSGVSKSQKGYVTRYDFGCVNPPGSALNPAEGGVAPTVSTTTNCVLGTLGDVDTQAARLQLRWSDDGPVEVNLVADYTNENRTPAGEVLTFADYSAPWVRGNAPAVPFDSRYICGRFCNYATFTMPGGPWTGPLLPGFPVAESNYRPESNFEGWGVSGQIDWDIADRLRLTSISAYRAFNTLYFSDTDLSPSAINGQVGDLDFWSFTQELRLNGAFGPGDLVEWTLGGFYLDQRTLNALTVEIRYVPWPGQFEQNDPVDASSKAVFGQVIVTPFEELTLVGGLRYTEEEKRYEFYRRTVFGEPHPFLPFDGEVGTYQGDKVDYRIAAQYRFTPDVMGYAQMATGFKGGGINPRPFTQFQVVPFEPETLTTWEVGLKTQFGRAARVNFAAFYSDYKDIQLTLLSCPQFSDPSTPDDDDGPCAANANAGDGRIKGAEMEAYLNPVDGLTIDGTVSWLDFEYTRINPFAGGPTTPQGPQLDDVTPYTPEWKWSIGLQYELLLDNWGSLTPRFDAAYQSVTFSNPANTDLERIDGYVLANARLTWRNFAEDLSIALEVTNVFDKYYTLTAYDASASAGFASVQPGRPREWALSLRKDF